MDIRPKIAGLALLAGASALSGCDSDPAPSRPGASPASSAPAIAAACDDPDIDFGPIRKREVLTEVGQRITIRSPKGGRLDSTFEPVTRYVAQVVTAGDIPRQLVYNAFLHRINPDSVSPSMGEVAHSGAGATTVHGPGRIVEFKGVYAREATFDYRCGALTVSGTVTSWTSTVTGVLDCDEKPRAGEKMATEAAALRCTD
ncbi:hypothetical protein AB0J80_19780 [Actinoplanes sp. NPDC049548]|uniref:hypothetical protein n=1 Tax=Actinoplanes sp. NPDC049548 TaxID=3155152 RepID=UPI003413DF75